jgi:hypothetical protein
MDPCLRLALLDAAHSCDLVRELIRRPHWERRSRYPELIAAEVPADVREARWTGRSLLLPALPDGADKEIRSLTGIEGYARLRKVDLRISQVEDLRPLLALPALELVWLGVPERADLDPLLSCDRLRRVHIDGPVHPATPAYEVLETLAARGVQVDNLLPDPDEVTRPFADPILKLAVLEELQASVGLPTVHFFDEYEFDDDNLTRLLAVEVSPEQLDGIEKLRWLCGESEIIFMVWAQFDGESDEFDIRSLDGIEALRNLKELAVTSLEFLPADQVTALRARGVTVEGY